MPDTPMRAACTRSCARGPRSSAFRGGPAGRSRRRQSGEPRTRRRDTPRGSRPCPRNAIGRRRVRTFPGRRDIRLRTPSISSDARCVATVSPAAVQQSSSSVAPASPPPSSPRGSSTSAISACSRCCSAQAFPSPEAPFTRGSICGSWVRRRFPRAWSSFAIGPRGGNERARENARVRAWATYRGSKRTVLEPLGPGMRLLPL